MCDQSREKNEGKDGDIRQCQLTFSFPWHLQCVSPQQRQHRLSHWGVALMSASKEESQLTLAIRVFVFSSSSSIITSLSLFSLL